jgi:hypothetical protein
MTSLYRKSKSLYIKNCLVVMIVRFVIDEGVPFRTDDREFLSFSCCCFGNMASRAVLLDIGSSFYGLSNPTEGTILPISFVAEILVLPTHC